MTYKYTLKEIQDTPELHDKIFIEESTSEGLAKVLVKLAYHCGVDKEKFIRMLSEIKPKEGNND